METSSAFDLGESLLPGDIGVNVGIRLLQILFFRFTIAVCLGIKRIRSMEWLCCEVISASMGFSVEVFSDELFDTYLLRGISYVGF